MAEAKEKDLSKNPISDLPMFSKESPFRNLLIVAGMIIILEILILVFIPLHHLSPLIEALTVSLLLILSLSPALHFFMFLPMAQRIEEREIAEAALMQERDQLELRVNERTAELGRRNHETTLLREMGDLFQACTSTDEAYRVIANFAGKLFPNLTGALFIRNPSCTDLENQASWGDWPKDLQANVIPIQECWALRLGRIRVETELQTNAVCHHELFPGCGHICVPMIAHGESLGVLYLQLKDQFEVEPILIKGVETLALSMSEQISLALANLQLRETLRFQSIRDPLTGLYNRRYLEETLARELLRAERAKKPLGVIMLDIDHFKKFNDMFGHDGGDAMLRELGMFLQKNTRGSDIACRFGGEEFILILPETPLDAVKERAENLRCKVKEVSVHHRGQLLGSLTLSFGIAIFPDHETAMDELIRAADQALYQAKQGGRDQVVIAKTVDSSL